MKKQGPFCASPAGEVHLLFDDLLKEWEHALDVFPVRIPDDIRRKMLETLIEVLHEVNKLTSVTMVSEAVMAKSTGLIEPGQLMADKGYTVKSLIKRFTLLEDIFWDHLFVALKEREEICHNGASGEQILDEYRSLSQRVRRIFHEVMGTIAHAYVGEMNTLFAEKEQMLNINERTVCESIIESLLPPASLKAPGFDIYGKILAAKSVGGDYWNVSIRPDGYIDVILSDVMGHGLASALLVSMIKYLFMAYSSQYSSMKAIIGRLNDTIMKDTPPDLFITFLYARLSEREQSLHFISAGNPPPLLVRKGKIEELEKGDIPLGLFRDYEYHTHMVKLVAGDTILLLSDGLFDARDGHGEFFGLERIRYILSASGDLSPAEIVMRLMDEATSFCGTRACSDDMTAVAIRFSGSPNLQGY
jgi:serine phosphatase RsbU (regulator of sigma subunit)